MIIRFNIDDRSQSFAAILVIIVGLSGFGFAVMHYGETVSNYFTSGSHGSHLVIEGLIAFFVAILLAKEKYQSAILTMLAYSFCFLAILYGAYNLLLYFFHAMSEYLQVVLFIAVLILVFLIALASGKRLESTFWQPVCGVVFTFVAFYVMSLNYVHLSWSHPVFPISYESGYVTDHSKALLMCFSNLFGFVGNTEGIAPDKQDAFEHLIWTTRVMGAFIVLALANCLNNYTESRRHNTLGDLVKACIWPALSLSLICILAGLAHFEIFGGIALLVFGVLGVWCALHMCNSNKNRIFNLLGVLVSLVSIAAINLAFTIMYDGLGSDDVSSGSVLSLIIPIFGNDDFGMTLKSGLPISLIVLHYALTFVSWSLFFGKFLSLFNQKGSMATV